MSVWRVLMVCVAALGLSAGVANAQGTISAACTSAGQTADCSSGWYTSPVSVVWQASPAPLSTSGCDLGIQYIFASDTNQTLTCTANYSGSSNTQSFRLQVELSSPSATATPDRPPDANGWYNHPFTVSFTGSAFSHFPTDPGPCAPAQAYSGPSTAGGSLSASCTDNAGKTAGASFPFRYDASPPSLSANSQPADGSVALSWQASSGPAPLAWVQVARDPGVAAATATVLYQGAGTSYQDKRVRNGTRYTYTVTAMDQAGNMSQQTVSATPGARLLTPAPGARLNAPPALKWTAIPKATYYNVQLFKGKAQVLSAWPAKPGLKLKRSWRFRGHRRHLARGTYKWYVWPGFGARKAAHYGRRIGSATFVIR